MFKIFLVQVCSSLLFISAAIADNHLGTVKAANGEVTVVRAKKTLKVKVKDKVFKDDVVSTGKKSLVVIRLKGGSSLKLGSVSKLKLMPPRSKEGLNLLAGSLFSKVRKARAKDKRRFRVRTRTAVAGVRGTEFFTSYGTDKKGEDIWLCVNEGSVEVEQEKTKRKVLVKAGEGISVTSKKGISKPRPLAWTKKLNWKMDPSEGELYNKVNIEEAYTDLLDQDYD